MGVGAADSYSVGSSQRMVVVASSLMRPLFLTVIGSFTEGVVVPETFAEHGSLPLVAFALGAFAACHFLFEAVLMRLDLDLVFFLVVLTGVGGGSKYLCKLFTREGIRLESAKPCLAMLNRAAAFIKLSRTVRSSSLTEDGSS